MITRDFDAMLAEKAGIRPTFKVGGQVFTLRAKLPYAKWNKLIDVMRSEDGDADESTRVFFNTVLIKADRQRFLDLLYREDDDDDDEAAIGFQEINELTDWILGHFTGKPQNSSDGSSPGANGTGPQPNVVSLSSKQPANA